MNLPSGCGLHQGPPSPFSWTQLGTHQTNHGKLTSVHISSPKLGGVCPKNGHLGLTLVFSKYIGGTPLWVGLSSLSTTFLHRIPYRSKVKAFDTTHFSTTLQPTLTGPLHVANAALPVLWSCRSFISLPTSS